MGGRLIKIDRGAVQYVSPVLQGLCSLTPGQPVTEADLAPVIELLVQTLETAAGLRTGEIPPGLLTNRRISLPPGPVTLSFSGGVADLIRQSPRTPLRTETSACCWAAPSGAALYAGRLRLGGGNHPGDGNRRRLPQHPAVRQHGVRPGRDVPLQNLPVIALTDQEQALPGCRLAQRVAQIRDRWEADSPAVLFLPGMRSPGYDTLSDLAGRLAEALPQLGSPSVVVTGADMAKALGRALATRLTGPPAVPGRLGASGRQFSGRGRARRSGNRLSGGKKTLVLA